MDPNGQPSPVLDGPVTAGFVRDLPKAEIHVHLEGCVPPELLERAARRAGVASPPQGGFTGLAAMLDGLDRACRLLDERGDLVELGRRYAESTIKNGISYSDLIVNPSHWPAWRDRLAVFLGALEEGLASGEQSGAPPCGLVVSIGRWQSSEEAESLVAAIESMRSERIVGLSIDGDESAPGAGGTRFLGAIRRARAIGLGLAVHAGESSGPDGVRDAIEVLGADRIDHGIAAIRDRALVEELIERRVPLDVCPTSNVALGLVSSVSAHPLEALRRAGVAISINTDDPVLFGTSLIGEYQACAASFAWDRRVLGQLATTSIDASFAPETVRRALRQQLATFLASPA